MIQSNSAYSKVVVIGPGIVGMPMAALLADATRRLDARPGEVVVVQRKSATSGWKVDAINRGASPIGGIEPDLDQLVATNAAARTLRASHEYCEVGDADAILICVQTDRQGISPDYGPLLDALHGVASALAHSLVRKRPLVVIESTLAPSTMQSVVRPLFESYGLREGVDVSLGNSPNRVMPGRLVRRLTNGVKIVGALHPLTTRRVVALYGRIVTNGQLLPTNSLTAEVVKTLENAYRDVRIAFATELARWCDARDVDFYALRDRINSRLANIDDASYDGTAVPSGALLVPTIGVGGHCLPKDGILLWWRALEHGLGSDYSVILAARDVNDESPMATLGIAVALGARLAGCRVAVLGAAYRPNAADTRNSPSLELALMLRAARANVIVHDPYVASRDANISRLRLTTNFTNCIEDALRDAAIVFVGTGHSVYRDLPSRFDTLAPAARVVVDGANLYGAEEFAGTPVRYSGIGRGRQQPTKELVASVLAQFRAIERAVANEVGEVSALLNAHYAEARHNQIAFDTVQALARTCATGCDIVDRGPASVTVPLAGFSSRLASRALARWGGVPDDLSALAPRERLRGVVDRPSRLRDSRVIMREPSLDG